MFDGKRFPSFFEVWTNKYDTDHYVRHLYSFRNYKDALRTYLEIELGDDVPEVELKYQEHPGCYKQRTIPLRDKRIAYDIDGAMIKIERRRVYEQV